SITPLVAFSANISGTPTAIGLPINIQEMRFNSIRPALSYYTASFVANVTQAIDGNSLTTAEVRTIGLDSNLDGYGQLIVATDITSALRANNTVVIDLLNHRRGEGSAPTVTGTFSIQTYNTATGVVLRENLFVTQAFRHQTNPISTSYVATAINMGATAQLAVRLVARNEGGSGAAVDWYEVGEIGIESFYQPRGDSGEIFLFGAGYEGRTDVDGTVTDYLGAAPGRLFQLPDQVIASIYEQEIGLSVDLESFAAAGNFFTTEALRFDGGIGAGWALEQGNARDILDALAKQATAMLFPTFEGTWGIRPFRTDTPVHQAFDSSDILTEAGSEQQRPEDRMSTVQLTLGNLQTVYNHIEVRYKYNAGSRKYDGVWQVTKDGSNLPDGTLDKAAVEETCLTSWLRYGDLEPLIVEASWIADDTTAAYYLRHLALYFSQQRLGVQFETTFKGACLQVGDFITITDNSLPIGDNGGIFEVHTIRYMPLKGRIQLSASRVSSIPDVTRPPAPAALVGCERFATTAGMLACWDFEEVSGSRIDHLHEYSLTAVNTPLGVTGKVGTAVQFLRASSQYLAGENVLSGAFTGTFTLACWVRMLSIPSEFWAIVSNESPSTGYPDREIFVGMNAGGTVHVACGHSNGGGALNTTAALPFTGTAADWTLLRVWRTLDATFNGTLYVQINNATPESVNFTNALPHAQSGFLVGASYAGGGSITYHANLLLDSLMLWSRVLTQAEHDAIWNGGLG
ncbi:MAG TPA: LamG-like jellyroll fold domain-containing protein, partial [Candidatus Tectomicrobia bacterium]